LFNLDSGVFWTPESIASHVRGKLFASWEEPEGEWSWISRADITPEGRFRFRIKNPSVYAQVWADWTYNSKTLALAELLGFNPAPQRSIAIPDDEHGGEPIHTFVGQRQMKNIWVADVGPKSGMEPERRFVRNVSATLSQSHVFEFGETELRDLSFNLLPAHKIFKGREGTTHKYEALERLWESSPSLFKFSPDSAVPDVDPFTADGFAHWYSLDEESMRSFKPERPYPGLEAYDVRLSMRKTVSPA
jgi:hypothetical protein